MNCKLLFFTGCILINIASLSAQANPCTQFEQYRQLDFWVGNWQVEDTLGNTVGTSQIEVILDSCVILENWKGVQAVKGKSFNYYNAKSKMWQQKWIDNFGNPLEFEGQVKNNSIYYKAKTTDKFGNDVQQLMVIKKLDDNKVLQTWKSSKDGNNWNLLFKGIYKRKTTASD
jgi:hypothetical protein